MSLERKLVAGVVVLLLAGGAAGAGLAASGRGGPARQTRHAPPFRVTHAGFVRASAWFLGLDVATLRHEVKSGRTIADVADATAGKSARGLTAYLVRAASSRLQLVADRPFSPAQERVLRAWLRRRITGFLKDTCPLNLSGLRRRMAGCPGMSI